MSNYTLSRQALGLNLYWNVTVDSTKYKAIIVDFDATLADTEKLHYESAVRTLEEYGMTFVSFKEHIFRYTGTGHRFIFNKVIREQNSDADVEELLKRRREIYSELLEEKSVEPIPGAIEFLHSVHHHQVKLGLVSGGFRKDIELVMEIAEIPDYFCAKVTVDDVQTPKPHPESFLKAAELLDESPNDILVFEDAINGLTAAQKAGMHYIGVASHSKNTEKYLEFDPQITLIHNFLKVKVT